MILPIFCIFATQNNTLYYMLQLRIKEICKEQGITLNTLADRIGMSQPSISGLATGKQKPSFDTLEKLASALNVEVGELFTPKNDFIAFVRMNGQTHTFTAPGDLKAFADTITDLQLCCNEPEPQHDSNDVTQMYQDKAQEAKTEDSETQGE